VSNAHRRSAGRSAATGESPHGRVQRRELGYLPLASWSTHPTDRPPRCDLLRRVRLRRLPSQPICSRWCCCRWGGGKRSSLSRPTIGATSLHRLQNAVECPAPHSAHLVHRVPPAALDGSSRWRGLLPGPGVVAKDGTSQAVSSGSLGGPEGTHAARPLLHEGTGRVCQGRQPSLMRPCCTWKVPLHFPSSGSPQILMASASFAQVVPLGWA
jgi:hypothetical protein